MEDHPHGLTDHAAVDVLLGEAADEEIDSVDTLHRIVVRAAEHDAGIDRRESCHVRGRKHQVRIGLPELIDDRCAQPVAVPEVLPRGIWAEIAGIPDRLVDIRTL